MQLLPDPLVMFYQSLIWLHVAVGALTLVLFWLPLCVPRGSEKHKQVGHWYVYAMYFICGSGALMASMVLISPQYFKPELFSRATDIAAVESAVRTFWFFLLFLCVLIFCNLRQALFAFGEKPGKRHALPWKACVLPATLLLFSVALAFIALSASHILFGIFAALGATTSIAMLRYLRQPEVTKKQQIVEHIGNICGSGIGLYTAFFAFGGRTLFEALGQWQLMFWLLPGVVGTLLIHYAVKPYKTDNQKTIRSLTQPQ